MLTTVVRARERIPEAFLWQAFHDFAKAAHHMRTVHFDERVAPLGKDHYVLHLDLKHENVLLGDAPADKRFMTYPAIKVGDWGMAACTSLEDPYNSRVWRGRGTIVWFPPEQRNFGRYGSNWRYPVLGASNAPFGMSHVIWQIGANMFGLMNLDQHNEKLDEQVDRHEKKEAVLRQCGYSMFEELRSRTYSPELAALVEDCLRLDPQRRPGVRELLRRTEDGLKPYLDRWARTRECPSLKVKIV
ncbi:hypothetical protein LTR90_003223 [Exophiala xenobiotica]|nr:hypothetical protein LTR90_003223 [Exophiala xenobiotica]